MPRHFSKVIVELPDSLSDPPYAVVTIDCDVCGEEEIRIHVQHLGTVLRTLGDTVASIADDGTAQAFGAGPVPSTPENRTKMREFLNREYPGWKAGRLRARS